MRKLLQFTLLTLLATLVSLTAMADETVTFSGLGYSNGEEVTTVNADNFTVTFDKGSNANGSAPYYSNNNKALRILNGNSFTISSDYLITNIDIVCTNESNGPINLTMTTLPPTSWSNSSGATGTWEANGTEVSSVTFNANGYVLIKSITVTYTPTSSNQVVSEDYTIDFESEASTYSAWDFTNMVSKQSGISTHGGSYYGITGNGNNSGTATASITTKKKIATPNTLTCYVSKTSNNTTASTWKIQVSSDGSVWTDVESTSATDMSKGEWKEFTANLSSYTNVYVRIYYDGSTAIRAIDDLTLDTSAPAVATPTFSPAGGEYSEAQSVTISCETVGASIYYTTDGSTPTVESTKYTEPISVSKTTTIKAIAYVGTDHSSVASATFTIPSETIYKKVTANDDLTDGKYLIVYEEGSFAFDGSLKTLDAVSNYQQMEITKDIIITDKDIYFTIDVNAGTIQSASGYYIGINGGSNGLSQSISNQYQNNIRIDEHAVIVSGNNMTLSFNKTSGQTRFRYFKNGGQEPIQLYKEVKGVELVKMNTDGFVTYVPKNDIDWEKTLAKNISDVDVHGYKVIQFTQESAVFGEFGVGENEKLIPAGTPIIIKGQAGLNELVIVSTEDGIVAPSNNKLHASDGTVTATADQHLLVFQKTSDWTSDDPYNNYAFFKLAVGRTIPERKAYLNGADVSEEITVTTNAAMGIFLLEDLGKPQDSGTTGITQYSVQQNDSWIADGVVFDLSGRKIAESLQRMNGLAKGIYIVNGRKVVIK